MGCFFEHPNRQHGKNYEKEILQATILARFGFEVYLVKECSTGGKKIDALVNGVPVDFKKVGLGNSAIKDAYQDGMKKEHCKGIIVHIEQERQYVISRHGIKKTVSLNQAVRNYTKQNNNGFLAIWIADKKEFRVFDMKKIRASNEGSSEAGLNKI